MNIMQYKMTPIHYVTQLYTIYFIINSNKITNLKKGLNGYSVQYVISIAYLWSYKFAAPITFFREIQN